MDGGRVRLREPRKGRTRKGRKKFAANWREPRLFIIYAVNENGRMADGFAPIIDGTLASCDRLFEMLQAYQVSIKITEAYCLLILLYISNPVVTSLRGLQQASELKRLGCARTSLGSLSESVAIFDSQRLNPILESPGEKQESIGSDTRLKDVQHTLTLVDGSIVKALPRIAMASFREAQAGSGKNVK